MTDDYKTGVFVALRSREMSARHERAKFDSNGRTGRNRPRRKNTSALRLFLGIYPPVEVAGQLLKHMRELDSLPPHREVATEQVHLTLQFIGDTDPRRLDDVIESIDRAKKGIYAFQLQPHVFIAYPKAIEQPDGQYRRRPSPRLIAAETDAPSNLLELHRRLAHRLSRRPRRDAADRFAPHFTLCRFRSYRSTEYPLAQLDWSTSGHSLPDSDSLVFDVDSFSLMKSTLRRDGAIHERIASWPLT